MDAVAAGEKLSDATANVQVIFLSDFNTNS